eukprot:COSAG04_NODE_12177_length_666_cov_1.543210_1_plen_85_part_00
MCGEPAEAAGAALSVAQLEQLSAELRSEDEAGRLHAGYALGMAAPATPGAVPALVAALREQGQRQQQQRPRRPQRRHDGVALTP